MICVVGAVRPEDGCALTVGGVGEPDSIRSRSLDRSKLRLGGFKNGLSSDAPMSTRLRGMG